MGGKDNPLCVRDTTHSPPPQNTQKQKHANTKQSKKQKRSGTTKNKTQKEKNFIYIYMEPPCCTCGSVSAVHRRHGVRHPPGGTPNTQ